MKDDISDIQSYYDDAVESELVRLERHQLERDITWRYLDRYLPPKGAILDIGAATGGYTLELAKRRYTVTAADLSSNLIELCQRRVSEEELEKSVRFFVADARDLSDIKDDTFDAVLLMGPLYHLILEGDRKTALREAFDLLKPGGAIFSSFISRYGILGDVMKNIPQWIENQSEVRSIMEQGRDPDGMHGGGFRGYFTTISEIATLHEEVGFKTLVVAGVEPAISADDESYNKLEGERRKLWLDLLYEISTEESIIAASRHLLYIGTKPG
ncbi:MAG: class I SAM-dependent methyltransferase [Dehalococcoidales bacterium]|nr:MAG: class I SAM-dependent methyltransferase [Dehalococcoidales bacterium]